MVQGAASWIQLKMAAIKAAEARAAAEKEEGETTKLLEKVEKPIEDSQPMDMVTHMEGTPSRTTTEREIRKLKKKIREIQRLQQRSMGDTNFEKSQYEKLVKTKEYEQKIGQLHHLLET